MTNGEPAPAASSPLLLVALSAASIVVSSCVSDRYVGSLGRDGTYANRGYGLAVRLSHEGLLDRWRPIDPGRLDDAPPLARPVIRDAPLDLDGNGTLEIGETTRHLTPTLQLLSKASSATISIDVTILGGEHREAALDGLLAHEIAQITHTTSAARALLGSARASTIGLGWETRIVEATRGRNGGPPASYLVALVDQRDFVAEEGRTRRQIVRVILAAPNLTDALRRDHELLLEALFLNRRGGSTMVREQW